MSVPTKAVKPNLRLAGSMAIKRSTTILGVCCAVSTVIFAYAYNYKRYVSFKAIDDKLNEPEARKEAYERAKKFKALRSFPGGVSGIKEYWSGAH